MMQVAFMSKSFTDDGSIMAYSLSDGGSDWRTIQFLSIGKDGSATELPDKLQNVKFSSMAWTHDGKVTRLHCLAVLLGGLCWQPSSASRSD